ncbi:MAG: S8 family serine peptidase [Phycisphaerales bacterium]
MILTRSAVLALTLLCGTAAALPAAAQPPAGKLPVKTADDLPRHEYTIEGRVSEFLVSDAPFKAFVTKVKADIESALARYDITDPTTLQGYYSMLMQASVLDGRLDDALGFAERIRALEGKEARKLMTGQVLGAYVKSVKDSGGDKAKQAKIFDEDLYKRVSALPWDVVREEVISAKGRSELASPELILGGIKGQLDPIVEASKGVISSDIARGLVGARMTLDVMLGLQPAIGKVYGQIIDSHKTVMKDVWSERLVTLSEKDAGTPVVAVVWDSGTDVALFPNRLFVNPKEIAGNSKDDDGNGFADDVNGIAYDLEARPTPELLHPLSEMKADPKLVTSHMKGMMDVQANIDSPEASAIKAYIRGLKADEVNAFQEDLGLFGNYSHGTHVAGIAAEGNPFVRLLPVRITFDFRSIPTLTPTVEGAQRTAAAARSCIAYMRAAGARVCNMSWGGSKADIEGALEAKNVGKSPEERASLARELFKIERDALEEAMKSAPEILFVAAAGNSNNDNQFSELIPSGLNVPNMITVGAVDAAGKPTGFTTFGKNVKLYANGFEVNSYIPGGQQMKFSGTSMAAPNMTNLVAKLVALNPKLTTSEIIDLVTKGAEPMEGYEGRFVINPKKSIEMLRPSN